MRLSSLFGIAGEVVLLCISK